MRMLLRGREHDRRPAVRVPFTSIGAGREHLRDEGHIRVALRTFISQMAPGVGPRQRRARRDGRVDVAHAHFSHGVDRGAVAIAWLLAHPAKVVPIIGTQTLARIRSSADALKVKMNRRDWYDIMEANRGAPMP